MNKVNELDGKIAFIRNTIRKNIRLRNKTNPKEKLIPLFDYESSNNEEIEKVIPIYAEEIVISKKNGKIGRTDNRRVTVNNKIDVGIQKEKVTVQYPDGIVQQLTDNK